MDYILEKEGTEPYFVPVIKSELDKYGLSHFSFDGLSKEDAKKKALESGVKIKDRLGGTESEAPTVY
ncbi:hypothetical protein A0H81_14998 [Grifola frondosa]|uniref:Uncharacterized protein n=1 Tax=Grifola frondosa TaxID=5627 RepID=A0A1C7LJU4_GRIFR|nr:hypothetical protein A0H81_14998 [Grifola frondosa]